MKSKSISSCCGKIAQALLLVLLSATLASAQNFVRNPDFEEPLGPDNWTVVYTYPSGPADFLFAGRTTTAHKDIAPGTWDGGVGGSTNYWNKYGGHFAPNHTGLMQGYFRQVVSNLTPIANYAISAWMVQFTRNDNYLSRSKVYMETLGGPFGTTSKITLDVTANANNNPGGWARYTVTNQASTNGTIEIRLHYKKIQTIAQDWEYRNVNAFYDHVSVFPVAQFPNGYAPPFQIVSAQRTGSDVSLQWQTVRNNRYRIRASTNAANPASLWFPLEYDPKLDTNYHAAGTTFTFKTNIASLFHYDPAATINTRPEYRTQYYFDSNSPLFFRISSDPYQP